MGLAGRHLIGIALAILLNMAAAVPTQAQTEAAAPGAATASGISASEITLSAGRVLLGQLFVIAGARKIPNFSGTAARMTAYGLPVAEMLLVPTIALEIGGGLALALNWHPEVAAATLAAFTVPTTLVFHRFWAIPDAVAALREQTQFIKNAAVLGGLLTVAASSQGSRH